MKQQKVESILIQGYFGQSNLGDDILNLVGIKLCKEYFPDAKIYVYSIPRSDYILKFSDKVELVGNTYGRHFDLILHSGGGVFFDFKKGNLLQQIRNGVFRLIGPKLSFRAHDYYLKLVRKTRFESCNHRIGIGIGVGKFEPGSSKLFLSWRRLMGMNQLFVRDETSIANLKKIRVDLNTQISSDLAFLSQYWYTNESSVNPSNDIGVVLRDWGTKSEINRTINTILRLKSNGYALKFYSFNPDHDKEVIKILQNQNCELMLWNPEVITINDFVNDFSANRVIISSRAHGAIVGATLKLPAIIIEIEPKLKTIHGMLAKSSQLLQETFTEEELLSAVEQALIQDVHLVKEDLLKQSERNNVILEYLRAFSNE